MKLNMENKKNNSILLTVIGVATLLVALIGATFAYFTATDISDPQNVDTGKLNISTVLSSTSQSNIIPTTWDDTTIANNINSNANIAKFTFTVNGEDTDVRNAVYDVTLVGAVSPLTTVDNGVSAADQKGDSTQVLFKLVDSSNTVVASGNYGEITSGKKILSGKTITGGQTDTYTLCVYIEESGDNQDKLQGATVSATMTANAYTPKPVTPPAAS